MSFIIIDNTKCLQSAEMTPLLIKYFDKKKYQVTLISDGDNVSKLDMKVDGIILSGGPILLSEKTDLFLYSKNITALLRYPNTPILGICFGFQVLGVAYGGLVNTLGNRRRVKVSEEISVTNVKSSVLFKDCQETIKVYQCHNDYLVNCPNNFIITGRSNDNIIQAIESVDKLRFGVQFHPENSEDGHQILDNFTNLCLIKSKHNLFSTL